MTLTETQGYLVFGFLSIWGAPSRGRDAPPTVVDWGCRFALIGELNDPNGDLIRLTQHRLHAILIAIRRIRFDFCHDEFLSLRTRR